ncbi:DegT/DnrJ/EryC1/StrS family aminotransferase [Lysinibacillus fusiformis]|uniref:DegT/DnrJ/EryC1/StrS family aminotransferase n=1 Tax=Lysinibacillus fusiformis TaxID=28031 RepID=UPI001C10EA1D|nr:DegT/DnrJ/EryC1/StrS family aminotransferase [Lysinibacillus fusiformis]
MTIEFRDLKRQYQTYKSEIDQAIADVLKSGTFIGGEPVKVLEKELADYVGVKHCITCANGTDALTLVLLAWGIGEGDAVFVPDFTFFATAEVVAYAKATPIFIEVDEKTFNMDPQKLENAIKEVISEGKLNPKVIIPVDLFGLPANYPEIEDIGLKYELLVLEDGAQGFGGHINGKRACSFGHAATTSFFPAKPLGCYGDGGAIFTNDDELAELLNSLKVHGKGKDKYDNVRIGMNSRLDTIQAAILRVKLKAFIDHEVKDVNKIAAVYNKELNEIVKTPYIPEGYYSSYAQYTIKLKDGIDRENLINELNILGIPSMVYYPKMLSEQMVFNSTKVNKDVKLNISSKVLALPMHPYLNGDELDYIISEVKVAILKIEANN